MKVKFHEDSYIQGKRRVWHDLLDKCLGELGYNTDWKKQQLIQISEREKALVILRQLCDDFGDNEWESDLHLADIIEKHLGKHLYANQPTSPEAGE